MQAGALIQLNGGEYRLAAPIAASSYGEVWRAVRRADGLAVALKLVNREIDSCAEELYQVICKRIGAEE